MRTRVASGGVALAAVIAVGVFSPAALSGMNVLHVVGHGPRTGRLPSLGAVVSSRLPPYIAYDPPGGGIWLVKPDGTDAHQVGPPDGADPVWSPDATKILYQAPAPQNDQGVTADAYVMNADGTDQHPITPSAAQAGDWITYWSDGDFHWSPDGKHIVFTRRYGMGFSDVEIANADGSDPHAVPIRRFGVAASYSPDGSHLVFDSFAEGESTPSTATWGLYVVRRDGRGLRQITFYGGVGDPSWSPDGHRIIYSCLEDNSGFHGICEVSGKPRRERVLYANRYQTLVDPSWNANGRKILVTVERGENRPGQIALMSPSGGRLVKTGVLVAAGTYPDW
jgi:Tol biopolymer transport system component